MNLHGVCRKKFILLLLSSLLLSSLLSSCMLLPMEEETLPAPVIRAYESTEYMFASVVKGDLIQYVDVSVSDVPANEVTLAFSVGDVLISAVYVQNGDIVNKGDTIAELYRDDIEKKITEANFDLNKTKLKIEQEKELFTLGKKYLNVSGVSDAAHEIAINDLYTQVDILNTEIEQLTAQSAERVLYAPMNGTITYIRKTDDGDKSKKDERFAVIADKTLSVYTVTGSSSKYFNPGDKVMMKTGGSDFFSAEVADPAALGIISPKADTAYFTILEMPPDIKSSSYATVRHIIEEKPDVLHLPSRAIVTVGSERYVYLLKDNIKQLHPVRTGLVTNDGRTEIVDGLNDGDEVIID